MKLLKQPILKTTTMLAVFIAVSTAMLLNPAMAGDLSDFAGQTTGSGRIWWWWF